MVWAFQLLRETLHMCVSAAFHTGAEMPEPNTRGIFRAFKVDKLQSCYIEIDQKIDNIILLIYEC